MAEVRRSDTAFTITVASYPRRGMTVGDVRDFVRALDEQGVPDDVEVVDEHDHDTRHLTRLRVNHRVVVTPGDA